jgi:hypothetical protein
MASSQIVKDAHKMHAYLLSITLNAERREFHNADPESLSENDEIHVQESSSSSSRAPNSAVSSNIRQRSLLRSRKIDGDSSKTSSSSSSSYRQRRSRIIPDSDDDDEAGPSSTQQYHFRQRQSRTLIDSGSDAEIEKASPPPYHLRRTHRAQIRYIEDSSLSDTDSEKESGRRGLS